MNNRKSEEHTSVPDSEASVDYYVTTVNEQTPKKADVSINSDEEKAPIVVSIDRAGSVKVRIRKKSKRRKKKSNLALEENGIHLSDDGVLRHSTGSDEDAKKAARRSSSLSEKDLRRSSSSRPFQSEVLNRNGSGFSADATKREVFVRRRVKRRSSLKSTRRQGIFLDSSISLSASNPSKNPIAPEKHPKLSKQGDNAGTVREWSSFDSAENTGAAKNFNRQDVLATLNAFVMEVEEATTFAKQQAGSRKKDPSIRKSRSLNELIADSLYQNSVPNDFISNLTKSTDTTSPGAAPVRHHAKSASVEEHSVQSGSVFVSDHDMSLEEAPSFNHHQLLAKTSSEETRSGEGVFQEARSPSNPSQPSGQHRSFHGFSQSCSTKCSSRRDINYGLNHLNQFCKLLEQIGELRKQKQALLKRVDELEKEVKLLKDDRGWNAPFASESRPVHPMKRPNAAGRMKDFKEVISRTARKPSTDKNLHDSKTISQPLAIGSPTDPQAAQPLSVANPSGLRVPDRRINLSLRRRKKRAYSRDDLDLFSKDRWKFWKVSRGGEQNSTKDQVVSKLKAENSQGTATHLKSASVTLDRLLDRVDDQFSEKFVQWQTTSRSRAASRASECSRDLSIHSGRSSFSTTLPLPRGDGAKSKGRRSKEERCENEHKDSVRKKLERLVAVKKMSQTGRSRSYDRMIVASTGEGSIPHPAHSRSMSASADFHKSLPCVVPASSGTSGLKHARKSSGQTSSSSVEWNGLQEAFPTTLPEGKMLHRLNGNGHVRLRSPRSKKNLAANRNTWSSTKFTGSVYLPDTVDFVHKTNYETAGLIGDQLTLKLDQSDVQELNGAGDFRNDMNEENSPHVGASEKASVVGKKESKAKGKPLSSLLARYRADRDARSFRRSKNVEIVRLSSFELLATAAPAMSPVREEAESALLSRSLPDLAQSAVSGKSAQPSPDSEDPPEGARRYTVTVIDLKKSKNKKPLGKTYSTPQASHEQSKPTGEADVQRSTSLRPSGDVAKPKDDESRRAWITGNLLKSRRTGASVSSESITYRVTPSGDAAERTAPKYVKKPKTKLMNRFHKLSPKTRSKSMQRSDESVNEPSPTKKKVSKFFSFRSKSPSKAAKNTVAVPHDRIRPRAGTGDFPTRPVATVGSDRLSSTIGRSSERKHSNKIDEIRERFADEATSPSRQPSSPAPIAKGLVSRLSKRFARSDREKQGKKDAMSSGAQSKNANFLNARNRFEKRALSDSRTSSYNVNNNSSTCSVA